MPQWRDLNASSCGVMRSQMCITDTINNQTYIHTSTYMYMYTYLNTCVHMHTCMMMMISVSYLVMSEQTLWLRNTSPSQTESQALLSYPMHWWWLIPLQVHTCFPTQQVYHYQEYVRAPGYFYVAGAHAGKGLCLIEICD